jgi:nucleotide-binding universal stress UspA family protein
MYRQILLAVALQRWDEFSPHAVAAREAAVTLARGSGAQLTVLSVYDYDHEKPEALSFSPKALGLSAVDLHVQGKSPAACSTRACRKTSPADGCHVGRG